MLQRRDVRKFDESPLAPQFSTGYIRLLGDEMKMLDGLPSAAITVDWNGNRVHGNAHWNTLCRLQSAIFTLA